MKKIISVISLSFIVLLLLIFSFPSICFSKQPDSKAWEQYEEDSYYNKKNIIKSFNIVSVWIYYIASDGDKEEMIERVKKYDLKKSVKYQHWDHSVMLYKIDCKKRLDYVEKYIEYDDRGKSLHYSKNNNSEWESLWPDSTIQELYNRVCVTPKKPLKKKFR